jgi:hypothetical protein
MNRHKKFNKPNVWSDALERRILPRIHDRFLSKLHFMSGGLTEREVMSGLYVLCGFFSDPRLFS